jgi:ClpP class serine protease
MRRRRAGGGRVDTIKCNDAIEMILRQGNAEVAKLLNSEVIFLKSAMQQPVDDEVKHEIEELKAAAPKKGGHPKKLTVLLETTGGYIETVERIVNVFRMHYETVEYIVPNYAYSAGTVLALSGDELYMDYYSILGPIDPQIGADDGDGNLPGMGYLAKYEELVTQIN